MTLLQLLPTRRWCFSWYSLSIVFMYFRFCILLLCLYQTSHAWNWSLFSGFCNNYLPSDECLDLILIMLQLISGKTVYLTEENNRRITFSLSCKTILFQQSNVNINIFLLDYAHLLFITSAMLTSTFKFLCVYMFLLHRLLNNFTP